MIPSHHCKGAWYVVKICFFRLYLIHQEAIPNVATLPTQILSLNCFLLGDDSKRMFTVEIEKTKNVSILKDIIKEKNPSSLGNVDTKDLDLWKVSESFLLGDLGQKDVDIDECVELLPGDQISAIFEKISPDCLHVVAKAPIKGELIQAVHRRSFINTLIQASASEQGETDVVPELIFKRMSHCSSLSIAYKSSGYKQTLLNRGLAPSQAAKSTGYFNMQSKEVTAIHDGRRTAGGLSTTSPPIHLYHPTFGRFIQIVEDPNVQPTDEDLKSVQELMHYLSEIFRAETEYAQGLRQRLYKILRANILPTENPDATRPDGSITLRIGDSRIVSLIVEVKRELGEGGSDPTTQASFSMKRSWIHPSASDIPFYIDFTADCLIEPNDPREMLLPNIFNRWSWALAECFGRRIPRQDHCSTLD